MFFLSILSAKEVICRFRNENKTLEFCRFGPQRAMITCTFLARDFKTKTVFNTHRVTAFLKIVNDDKIKFTSFGYR